MANGIYPRQTPREVGGSSRNRTIWMYNYPECKVPSWTKAPSYPVQGTKDTRPANLNTRDRSVQTATSNSHTHSTHKLSQEREVTYGVCGLHVDTRFHTHICPINVPMKTSRLYEAGYFPQPFRKAEIVMIQKAGKTDFSKAGSWRPIALLSCLGKGLERLIARRMSHLTILEGVASPQQIGALLGRSAVDLTTCLAHDIEMALDKGLTATLVTMDVKGAFDFVLRNRLIVRLRQHGWPCTLIRLIFHFASDRTARVRLEDATTEDFLLACGLPQGSPLSPIIFLLYIADILADDPKLRFGYANNIGLLAEITCILDWGAENKVAFDHNKSEAIHFTRKHKQARDLLGIKAGELEIKVSIVPIRWLGVWFDKRLSFQHHVETKLALAKKAAQHHGHLTNTKGGLPAAAMRKAVVSCVLPIALYGAETWYGGMTKPALIRGSSTGSNVSLPTDEVSTGQKGLAIKLESVITTAARPILPTWKTTPTSSLLRDAGLPPSKVALEGTRLQRAADLVPKCPRPALLQLQYLPGSKDLIVLQTKKEAAKAFHAWLRTVPDSHMVVFSDGSRATNGATGYGFVIYRGNRRVAQGCGRLGLAEVFDAEAEGARAGLRRALLTSQGRPIHIRIDNTSVIQGIRGEAPDSSQAAVLEIQAVARIYDIHTHWAPGHQGI
ncbi:reverse transcriptase RNaseH [Colletotrichum incanum]|nr:reverse transcriptase RNaseH [Colletotrichum incanum]